MNDQKIETVPLNEIEVGQLFYVPGAPEEGLRIKVRKGEHGVVRLNSGGYHDFYRPEGVSCLLAESLDTTYEEAVAAATPKPLTFGDLEGGDQFMLANRGHLSDVFVKLGRPVGGYTAIWRDQAPDGTWATPCVIGARSEVERV